MSMHVYTSNGSSYVIADSPEAANLFFSDWIGSPEPLTGLTWAEVPDSQNIEAWQLRTQTAGEWVAQIGVPAGCILA